MGNRIIFAILLFSVSGLLVPVSADVSLSGYGRMGIYESPSQNQFKDVIESSLNDLQFYIVGKGVPTAASLSKGFTSDSVIPEYWERRTPPDTLDLEYNADLDMFYTVPEHWKLITNDQLLEATNPIPRTVLFGQTVVGGLFGNSYSGDIDITMPYKMVVRYDSNSNGMEMYVIDSDSLTEEEWDNFPLLDEGAIFPIPALTDMPTIQFDVESETEDGIESVIPDLAGTGFGLSPLEYPAAEIPATMAEAEAKLQAEKLGEFPFSLITRTINLDFLGITGDGLSWTIGATADNGPTFTATIRLSDNGDDSNKSIFIGEGFGPLTLTGPETPIQIGPERPIGNFVTDSNYDDGTHAPFDQEQWNILNDELEHSWVLMNDLKTSQYFWSSEGGLLTMSDPYVRNSAGYVMLHPSGNPILKVQKVAKMLIEEYFRQAQLNSKTQSPIGTGQVSQTARPNTAPPVVDALAYHTYARMPNPLTGGTPYGGFESAASQDAALQEAIAVSITNYPLSFR